MILCVCKCVLGGSLGCVWQQRALLVGSVPPDLLEEWAAEAGAGFRKVQAEEAKARCASWRA